jgi:molybdopterin converting factor small subunit
MQVEFLGIPRERAGIEEIELDAPTLGDALEELARRYPRFGELVAGRRLHSSMAASLNADVFISDPATPLHTNDRLLILSADAGG